MPEWTSLARWMIVLGLALAGLGGVVWLIGRAGLPLGHLPGDLRFQSGPITCFVPLASMIVISLVLTVVVNLIARWLAR
jgi:Protein of unknown function (DUF2905)